MEPFDYTACYCEENIWHLCRHPAVSGADKKVVWISSESGVCPLWHQRAAQSVDQPVWWDYHVILLVNNGEWLVWDLDTTLTMPISASTYIDRTFASHQSGSSVFDPLFRVMDADYYRREFASDRSHMRDARGQWQAPPPAWDVILPHTSTFPDMVDFRSSLHGELLSLPQLRTLTAVSRS